MTGYVALALLGALGYGALGVFLMAARHAGMEFPAILAWRFLLAACGLLPLVVGRLPRSPRRAVLAAFALGAVVTGSLAFAYAAAIERLGAGRSAVLLYLYPGIVVLLDWAFNGRRPRALDGAAVALGLAGCVLTAGSTAGPGGISVTGVVLGVASAVIYAVYLVVSGRVIRHVDHWVATFGVCTGAAFTFTVLALLSPAPFLPPTAAAWGATVGMALASTLLPMAAVFVAVHHLGASTAALLMTTELLFATALGTIILGEHLGPTQAAGAVLVLAAVGLAQSRSRKA